MADIPKYEPLPKAVENPTVAKSVSNPNAFAKPGSASVRFRPMSAKRGPGRPRKHKADPRKVTFY